MTHASVHCQPNTGQVDVLFAAAAAVFMPLEFEC